MRAIPLIISTLLLSACAQKGSNPADPYEQFNRKVHAFNVVFDNAILKPPAVAYVSLVPAPVRGSVNNFFSNIYMVPTVANDLLQADFRYALKDSWRFFINSTIGIGGLFDVATRFGLPPHTNDLGLTFAKWGDTNSPYLVIPFAGPSTIRDGMGMGIELVAFTPYSWFIGDMDALFFASTGLRYVDIRSNYFDAEKLMKEALDEYTFMRDAWLQHRQYQITGVETSGSGSTESAEPAGVGEDYIDE